MPVISFWNAMDRESGQTYSIIALATYLAVEHNYRILVIDGSFDDETIEKAFWKKKENKALQTLQGGRVDISSGAEGLISAVASNKATPEIIPNYTRIVFKNRLDILLGLKTRIEEDFEKSMMLYKDVVTIANKYYDLVLIDLKKGVKSPSAATLLKMSNIIVYTLPPNLINIDHFLTLRNSGKSIASTGKVLPLLTRSDEDSAYNVKNVTRKLKEKDIIANIPYYSRFMEAIGESRAAQFITSAKLSGKSGEFFDELNRDCQIIINKINELNQMS